MYSCVLCGEDITVKPNGHGRCNNCEAHVKILDYGGDDSMNDANRMTNSIEKLTVLRMMELDFEELLGHAGEVSAYNEEVQRGLRRKAYAEGFEEGRIRESEKQYFDKAMEEVSKVVAETPQEKRDRIVEQAKADIEELKSVRAGNITGRRGYIPNGMALCDVDFVVNKQKRAVVALLKEQMYGDIQGKGITKCDPSDCFNVHIGKAIALHRALGLEVPDEYINAPQPTEVRAGDVVESTLTGKRIEATNVFREREDKMTVKTIKDFQNYYYIVDDSRSEGE